MQSGLDKIWTALNASGDSMVWWGEAWFRDLAPLEKCIWIFLNDRSDELGRWEIDEGAFRYFIGENCIVDWVLHVFGERIRRDGQFLILTEKEKSKKGLAVGVSADSLAELWNENCGALPRLSKMTEKRRKHSKAQLFKYPDIQHWISVLELWLKSDFCMTQWRPGFDDFLNENKRVATLEGRYNNRDDKPKSNLQLLDLSKAFKRGS